MNASVAVVLVLAYALSVPAHAGNDDGSRQNGQRPDYLKNNHGQLVPYGVGDLHPESRRERYFRERYLREHWTFGPEAHQRERLLRDFQDPSDALEGSDLPGERRDRYAGNPRVEPYGDDAGPSFRYYLRPSDEEDLERADFGRFSIQIDEDNEPADVIYYQLPVSPRYGR